MSRIFNADNPVWSFIGKLLDAIVLHLIWLVFSLGIVTFGGSTTAFHYAMMKDSADEDPHYIKSFWKSFKLNFKPGIWLGLFFLIGGAALGFSLYYYYVLATASMFFAVMRGITVLLTILYLFVFVYAFAVLARFDMPVSRVLGTSLMMSIKHIGWTLTMLVCLLLPIGILIAFNFVPIIFIGYGLTVYLNSYILNHVLEPYVIQAGGEPWGKHDPEPDHWEIPEEELAENAGVGLLSQQELDEIAAMKAKALGETTKEAKEEAQEEAVPEAKETEETKEAKEAAPEAKETEEAEETQKEAAPEAKETEEAEETVPETPEKVSEEVAEAEETKEVAEAEV